MSKANPCELPCINHLPVKNGFKLNKINKAFVAVCGICTLPFMPAHAKTALAEQNTPQNHTQFVTSQNNNLDQLVSNGVQSNASTQDKQTNLFYECSQVKTDAARLACYDKVVTMNAPPSFIEDKKPLDIAKSIKSTIKGKPKLVMAEDVVPLDADSVAQATEVLIVDDKTQKNLPKDLNHISKHDKHILSEVGVTQNEIEKYTPLSLAYDLDKNNERGKWTARPHRPMYLLPLYMNLDPNRSPQTPNQEAERFSPNEMRVPELKLQVSVKTKVAEDLFDTHADMWFGYTQQSHWQVYNEDNSRPFRATDYQPEIFLTQPVTADLPFGGRLRMLGAGAIHHSNGQSDPMSRSWNRLYLMGGAEWGRLSVIPTLWKRINTDTSSKPDDNPDIEDYMGYGDIKFLYDFENKKTLGGTIRYNPSTNKGAIQLDYIHPLHNNANAYIQLFKGYGESIIDYNHNNTGIGVGVVLNDWKGL